MHLIFWQQMTSHLQSPVIRALAEFPGVTVHWLVDSAPEVWRKAMGWESPDPGKAILVESPGETVIDELTDSRNQDTVHIFSTDRGSRCISEGMKRVLRGGGRFVLMSETANLMGAYGLLRIGFGFWRGVRLRHKVGFVLAIGSNGVRWYQMCGYPTEKIFPYGYFTESPRLDAHHQERDSRSRRLRLLFIGQCVPRKGIDLLLNALKDLGQFDWHLTIVGDGPQRGKLEDLTALLGLQDRVTFQGMLPNPEAMNVVHEGDLLLLPSRWDGWGAVVNEALMRGVPVICSDTCGAKDLLAHEDRGAVFKSESVESLRSCLSKWLAKGKRSDQDRRSLIDWSDCITGGSAAEYVRQVIDCVYKGAPRPIPPWLTTSVSHVSSHSLLS